MRYSHVTKSNDHCVWWVWICSTISWENRAHAPYDIAGCGLYSYTILSHIYKNIKKIKHKNCI